ncbi:MAG: lipid kinase YegS [Pirellulales bacterium]|nr:lipid kinase YegS [Pirellulales bacterium]
MSRSLFIVLHGKQAGNAGVRQAVTAQRQAGHRVEVRVTWEAGDAQRIVREAVDAGADTIVAGGGDGTINAVADALMHAAAGQPAAARPALGILPLGTANDFARSNEIPLDPVAALELITNSQPTPIDVGRVGQRTFINVATGGFGTQVTVETSEDLKRLLGGTAYLLTGLRRFNSIHSSAGSYRGPGFDWQGKFLVLAVGNGRQAGGGHILCPSAMINDGLFDVSILPDVELSQLPTALADLLRGGLAAVEQTVVRARVPWLEIRSETPLDINLDGEPTSGRELRFEVLPGAVRAHLAGSPLLKSDG